MKITFRIGRKAQPGTAYMVTSGIYDDYTVICVCADPATARQYARDYNRDHRDACEDDRAQVDEITFIAARTAA